MSHATSTPTASKPIDPLRELVAALPVDPASDVPPTVQRAVLLACRLQERAGELQTPQERRQQAELDRMMQSPRDKATLVEMTDQAFRSYTPERTADQLTHILDVQGVPRFFSPFERALLKGFQSFGRYLPGVAVPLVKERMHHETANVILPAERDLLAPYLEERRRAGVRMNVNYLGESLLGEREADHRLQNYLAALQYPEIEVISVKISTIYSQISALARRHSIDVLCDRLEVLYRAAAKSRYTRSDGTVTSKFVYLDMEEYRDMSITAEVFMRTLDRPGLERAAAGIALQAYIPDSFATERQLCEWARRRVAAGNAPITIRIVKGANLEMERVEASLRGWPLAPFKSKLETDANYKRMIQEALRDENRAAVRVGIASHNVFDLAFGLVLAAENDALARIQIEMLEGMANHQRRALLELMHDLLLYAPVCRREQFLNAIGYLIRRLDENTGPDNFLRHAFRIQVDSPDWERLAGDFQRAFTLIPTLSDRPRRTQDRRQPPVAAVPISNLKSEISDLKSPIANPPSQIANHFTNEPDTDWSLPHHALWADEILDRWHPRCGDAATEIPLVVAGEEIFADRQIRECRDPSRPGIVVGRYRQGTVADVERAVACARADEDGWRTMSPAARGEVLSRVAQELRIARGDLLGAALADAGKTLSESDPEVSEAVDFVEFYTEAADYFYQLPWLSAAGRGVVVVVSPWNFPIAIPCGGIAAALAAGNTVILKPASDAVLVAHELCQCFWRGGVSRRTLQLLPCPGGEAGQQLASHNGVDTVILTGGTATAQAMLAHKPTMHLLAETGGKNATIVTALSDREQAVKHVLHSAFSHSGQKCSATSLLILEDEVYEDAAFRELLCDAVESMAVGSAWNLPTRIGPLIRPPAGELEAALKELEPGESWAVMPHRRDDNPNLYSPGVKWDVSPGSVTHITEFFGPVLGVMRAKNLDEAISLVNATGYGLTSGLESLDDREQGRWREAIRAGNLYINRPTTGAIVLRQPFGGLGKSAFGPGIKAGGPNYVAQLMRFANNSPPFQGGSSSATPSASTASLSIRDPLLVAFREAVLELAHKPDEVDAADFARVVAAIGSYADEFDAEFGRAHDHFRLLGQDNFRRYLPVRELRVRVDPRDTLFETFACVAAARTVGSRVTVSFARGAQPLAVRRLEELTHDWAAGIEFVEEGDARLRDVIRARHTDRVRYAAPDRVPIIIRQASAETGIYVADTPVSAHGRIELLWYVLEQSISNDYHRYGNLGARGEEVRAETL